MLIHEYLDNLRYHFTGYAIIPVPLHVNRQRKRGFNQSLLLANIISKRTGLPLIEGELQKLKSTVPQAETKNRQERTHNLTHCFSVTHPELIAGKKILLVDDVCTSGATLIEAARTLKHAGAREIIGFVMAKTD